MIVRVKIILLMALTPAGWLGRTGLAMAAVSRKQTGGIAAVTTELQLAILRG